MWHVLHQFRLSESAQVRSQLEDELGVQDLTSRKDEIYGIINQVMKEMGVSPDDEEDDDDGSNFDPGSEDDKKKKEVRYPTMVCTSILLHYTHIIDLLFT